MNKKRMMKWFDCEYLSSHLKEISFRFHGLALGVVRLGEPNPERTVALRKLLEAKDAAVRAVVHPGG